VHEDRTPIALQDHDHPVRFRNVWLRHLEPVPPASVQYRSPEGETYRAQPENAAVTAARTALAGNYRDVPRVIALGVAQSGVM
jgi:hypothetical protein